MVSVSIVMSVGNRPNHLRNTLKAWSIVDYPDFDITIIDNGSKIPETASVVSEFKQRLPISFYENKKPQNVNMVWNKYGQGARGEYVIFAMMDEIISNKNIIQKMIEFENCRSSIFTYFMSEGETNNLKNIPWEQDPTFIPKPFTDQTSAGLLSHITGAYRKHWDWFGWFRSEDKGHLWLDQDVHLREMCLGISCETPQDVYCLHQFHPILPAPIDGLQPGFIYSTERQARLLESAQRDR